MNEELFVYGEKKLLKVSQNIANNFNQLLCKNILPNGKNGPHGHKMTKARVLAHLTVLNTFLYQKTNLEKYKASSSKSLSLLLQFSYNNIFFWTREEPFLSSTNGLIGQAWSVEPLIFIENLGLTDTIKHEYNINYFFSKISFDIDDGLWFDNDLAGVITKKNLTFNQQVWFTGLLISYDNHHLDFHKNIYIFLDNLLNHTKLTQKGVFQQAIRLRNSNILKRFLKSLIKIASYLKDFKIISEKNYGYHIFTLVGLAMIHDKYHSHSYFRSNKFYKALKVILKDSFYRKLENSKFSYRYNVVGLELPFVIKTFYDYFDANEKIKLESIYKKSIDKQIELFESESPDMLLDYITLKSRIYEIYRLFK